MGMEKFWGGTVAVEHVDRNPEIEGCPKGEEKGSWV